MLNASTLSPTLMELLIKLLAIPLSTIRLCKWLVISLEGGGGE